VTISGVAATIVVSAPRQAVIAPLREAMITLAISLVILALALIAAMLLQVRLGLRPLEKLRRSVADVRAGRDERVPEDQPAEIKPLVFELNALLTQNSENLERARRHVANLAHGLKTPLATLAISLPKDRDEAHGLIDVMERRIRHHLGRARAAALSGPVRAQTVVAPRLADLRVVLAKVHAEKSIALSVDISDDLAVACEQQDFDEMAGNILENAYKWARSEVAIHAQRRDGHRVALVIDDDGPGLTLEQTQEAVRPGARLDESAPGFGFGLPITRELAELYGGSLELGKSQLGGLRVTLLLPSA
jgi:signal transduction histidine kinase